MEYALSLTHKNDGGRKGVEARGVGGGGGGGGGGGRGGNDGGGPNTMIQQEIDGINQVFFILRLG